MVFFNWQMWLALVNPYVAEVMACREALSWIKDWGLANIRLQSNCLYVVNNLRNNISDLSYWGSFFYECRSLLDSLKLCYVCHIRRTLNQEVHALNCYSPWGSLRSFSLARLPSWSFVSLSQLIYLFWLFSPKKCCYIQIIN